MPEPALETTPIAKEIATKTTQAVKEAGFKFDKALEDEFDAALAKDQGKEPPAPKPAAKPPEQKPPVAKPDETELVDDLPPELFKPKEPEPVKTDAEKQAEHDAMVKEQTKGMSPKAADRFREIAKRAFESEQKAIKADALEKELTALKSSTVVKDLEERIAKLSQQNEEWDKLVQKHRLAEHPKFKAHYDAKIEEAIKGVKDLVGKEHEVEIDQLLRLPPSASRLERLNEIADSLPSIQSSAIGAAVATVDAVARERQQKLENAKAELQAEQKANEETFKSTEEKRVAELSKAWEVVQQRLKDPKTGLELFREVDGNEEWNKSVRERFEQARDIFSKGVNVESLAEITAMAVALPKYRDLFYMQKAMTEKLKAKVAELQGSEPRVRPGAEPKPQEFPTNESWIDSVVREAEKEGFLRK